MMITSRSRRSLGRLFLMLGLLVVLTAGSLAGAASERITYAIDVDIANLDPLNAIDPGSAAVFQQIYEPLVRINMKGGIDPTLARSWSVSQDKLTWTFTLRTGVKFHDGTAFNAGAVKAHFDRMFDPKKPNRSRGSFDMIADTKVVNDSTVAFVLKKPYAPFLSLMANPSVAICSPAAVAKWGDNYPFHPVGTGPWVFKEWVSGDHTTLVRNNNYWGMKPKVGELVFKPVPEPGARVIMLETGQADVANTLAPDEVQRLQSNSKIAVYKQPVLRGWFIGLNALEKPFDDVRVRRAMNYAIDVSAITDSILRGTARPLTAPVNSKVWGYSKQKDYAYDPAKAKQLLREAGYAQGFEANLWMPASGAGIVPEVSQAIQAMLGAVGVKVKITPFEMSAFIDNIIKDPEQSRKAGKQMILLGIGAGTGEASSIMNEFFHTESWAPVKYNRYFYSNKELDKLLSESLVTLDQAKQKAILAKAQKIVWEDAPWVFLYEMMGVYGARTNVKGLQWLPSNYILFNTVSK